MKLGILKRRAEMLDAVGAGLHPSAVTSPLAEKCTGFMPKCGGWDSNPRTPSGRDLESYARTSNARTLRASGPGEG